MKHLLLILKHLATWVLVPLLLAGFAWIYQFTRFDPAGSLTVLSYGQILGEYAILSLLSVCIGAFGLYVSYLFLSPALAQPIRYGKLLGLFLLLLLGPLLIVYGFSWLFFAVDWSFGLFLLLAYVLLLPFVLLGGWIQFFQQARKKEQARIRLEKQSLESQLALLEAQINPHFLFNTLNNIDILIDQQPSQASAYLQKLSEILRFVLYQTKQDQIPLSEEIAYLQAYLDLQRIRSAQPNFVRWEVKGEAGTHRIAPMILIVFVENALKYVADKRQEHAISFRLEVLPDRLCFTSQNTRKSQQATDFPGGLGLSSVRLRLEQLYPNRHRLNIRSTESHFFVSLELLTP